MSSVNCLRNFVTERLTAAAEEIFGVFEKAIAEYEEEIHRQHRLLEIVWKPQIKLHRTELLQKHVCKEEEVVLTDLQLDRNSTLDQEDPETPAVKEEQEKLCSSEEGEELTLKQEAESFSEESDHSEPEPISGQQLLPHSSPVPERQDQAGNDNSLTDCNIYTGINNFRCDTCGKYFKQQAGLYIHRRSHTGEKRHYCTACGKSFNVKSSLNRHMRVHTGEKPYACQQCEKCFRCKSNMLVHMRTHTGEKPYLCNTCGKRFGDKSVLNRHMRIHTVRNRIVVKCVRNVL